MVAALIGLVFPAFTRYSLDPGGAMDLEVIDNPDKARVEILADGELAGVVLYYLRGDESAFTHPQTDDRFRGEGIGGRHVRASHDAGRAQHLPVLPHCPV